MIAKQEPFHTRAQDLAPTKALHPRSWTQWADAKLNDVSSDPVRFRRLQIVLGVVALAWVGCVGTLMLRPVAAPETAAALPPLASAVPPLTQDASNSPSQTIESGPLSGSEPAPFNSDLWQQASRENVAPPASTTPPAAPSVLLPPARKAARRDDSAPLPPPRPLEFGPATGYDRWTAVYDISAHSVYLPDGTRLEAHSGLGNRLDDPRYVDERDHGATPPHLYELTLREELFHGVQALRLSPIGQGDVFGRTGLLAHPYMLGPNGDSNGCVSFKDYSVFLRAYQNGGVKRLVVVAQSTLGPRQDGRLASLRRGLESSD